jgi:seryl-tRNA synthetase
MLTLQVLREETNTVLEGLKKRNFKEAEDLIQQVIDNDKLRRETQNTLDTLKARSNADSKKIGELMKAGKAEEANTLRTAITQDKDKVKSLEESLTGFEKKQLEILYKLPNVPQLHCTGRKECRR